MFDTRFYVPSHSRLEPNTMGEAIIEIERLFSEALLILTILPEYCFTANALLLNGFYGLVCVNRKGGCKLNSEGMSPRVLVP